MPDVARFAPPARKTALALANAIVAPSEKFPPPGEATIAHLERMLSGWGAGTVARYAGLLGFLEHAARPAHRGRGFSSLGREEAERLLDRWFEASDLPRRTFALALTAPMRVAYFDDRAIYDTLGAKWRFHAVDERPRWMDRVTPGEELDGSPIECDVVVVGTGAGGAVVAAELAQKGLAVALVEEGKFHGRSDFDGRGIENIQRFYRQRGALGTIGNTFIPLPMGRLVGGSTAINTGTCWRTPEWVLESWVAEGLTDLAPERLAPYFERVERILEVATADEKVLGGVARVIARGCDVLGYSHLALKRNAPGCDGSAVCDFGCPSGARRSTEISYVPTALRSGGQLFTSVRATRLLREGDRVVGVEGVTPRGTIVPFRARATILAGGTIPTPTLLLGDPVAKKLPMLGRHLSIHPATMVSALFDEEIRGYSAIPQGYCVDELKREGILFLGASAPIDLGAAQFRFVGRKLTRLMEEYDKVASFGVMVEDASRGRVIRGPGGAPIALYNLGDEERERLRRGTEMLARIFLAAGAREVYPALHGHRVIRSSSDLARLASARPAAHDWLLTAFHPLGTCRMATSPARGVVSPDNAVFGSPGLFVSDGSVVPSSLGVNPQETIMALATRAADRIAAKLEATH